MNKSGKRGLVVALLVLVAGIALVATAAARDAKRVAARKEAAAAATLLDGFAGNSQDLAAAARHIDAALQHDPDCAAAWVEKARWRMKNAGRLNPAVLGSAEQDLRRGITAEPDHGNSYVLLGYALSQQHRFDEAAAAFETARRLQADSPWLNINVGQMHLLREDYPAAEELYRKALSEPRLPLNARIAAVDDLAAALAGHGEAAKARALYEELLAREEARTPWVMGNFSRILRIHLLDVKASEIWGRRALEKMDYRNGRENLGKTLYLAWAEALIVDEDEARAAALYAEAEQYEDSPADLLYEMSSYPHAHPIVAALAARGVPLDYRAELGRGRGTPPLLTLIADDNVAVATALLDAGAQVDEGGDSRTTALIIAAQFGKTGMVRLLLQRGASLEARNREGLTAEEVARKNGQTGAAGLIAAERQRRAQGQPGRPPL